MSRIIYTVRHGDVSVMFRHPDSVKSYLYTHLFGAPSGRLAEASSLIHEDDIELMEDLMRVSLWDGMRDLKVGVTTGTTYTVSVA